MIHIRLSYDDEKCVRALHIDGHAAKQGEPGFEVCVAVSTLAQGFVKAIRAMTPDIVFTHTKRSGHFVFERTALPTNGYEYRVLAEAFAIALTELANEYSAFIALETDF